MDVLLHGHMMFVETSGHAVSNAKRPILNFQEVSPWKLNWFPWFLTQSSFDWFNPWEVSPWEVEAQVDAGRRTSPALRSASSVEHPGLELSRGHQAAVKRQRVSLGHRASLIPRLRCKKGRHCVIQRDRSMSSAGHSMVARSVDNPQGVNI